ncbi:MAG TPA: DUF4293 family protein [Bacteroidia bacterium]|nr:DUF4293 family protein [Bacteroidia bacterium]
MIPRLQSIYLLVVAAAGMVMLLLPVSTINITPSGFEGSTAKVIRMDAFGKTEIAADSKVDAGHNKLLPYSIILSAVVSLIALFLVRKSQVQIKLCGLNYVLICLTLVLIFFYCDLQSSAKNILVVTDYHAGAMMPLLQLLANFFALRRIKLDARALNVMVQL